MTIQKIAFRCAIAGSLLIGLLSFSDDGLAAVDPRAVTPTSQPSDQTYPATPLEAGVVVRINSGGKAVTLNGETYAADNYFTGQGKSYSNPKVNDIKSTTQDELYRTERSTTQDRGSFGYSIPVTNGNYTVRLHFAEIYFGAPGGGPGGAGKRVFNATLEGKKVLSSFDINQQVGPTTAIIKTFTTEVTDQQLTINFTASVNQPKVSAIEVLGKGSPITPPTELSCAWNSLANSSLSRVESQSAKVNGKLYVLAGFTAGLKITDVTEIYDPATNKWSKGAPMPTPVTHMGAAVAGDDIWIVAGFVGNHPGKATAKVQIYNTKTNTWRAGPSLPNPRGSGAAVYHQGKLHFFGGLLPDRRTDVGEHYVLDLSNTDAGWTKAASLPNARNHLSGASVGGLVYAIGGQYGHDNRPKDQNFLHAYNPATNTWSRKANLPSARSHFEPGTMVHNGKIIIVGGRRGNYFFDDITEYDPATNSWSELCPLPGKLLAPVAKPFGNRLLIANGGENGTCCPLNQTRWLALESSSPEPQPVSTKLEAEKAALKGVQTANNHPKYSGAGFADYINPSGDYVEWTVNVPRAGDYDLTFTYALREGNRPLKIAVNGSTAASALSFPGTGSWSTWREVAIAYRLTKGVNKVRATAIGKSGANVDFLTVRPAGNPAARTQTISESPVALVTDRFEAELRFYPNPTTSIVTLKATRLVPGEPVHLSLLSVGGEVMWEKVVEETAADLSYSLSAEHLPAGVYFIRATQGETTVVRRMIKQ